MTYIQTQKATPTKENKTQAAKVQAKKKEDSTKRNTCLKSQIK